MFAINDTADTNYVSTGNYCPCKSICAEVHCLWCSIILGICDFRWCANIKIIGIISEHDVLPLRLITLECLWNKQNVQIRCRTSKVRENFNAVDSECVVWKYSIGHICQIVGDQYSYYKNHWIVYFKMKEQPPTQFAWLNIEPGKKRTIVIDRSR
jgi:hypothetical protein